jgi:hypothetical protein
MPEARPRPISPDGHQRAGVEQLHGQAEEADVQQQEDHVRVQQR